MVIAELFLLTFKRLSKLYTHTHTLIPLTLQTIHSVVRHLYDVSRGSIHQHDLDGNLPIHLAAENNHEEVVAYFAYLCGLSDDANDYGRTPLHLAVLGRSLKSAEHIVNAGSIGLLDKTDKNGVSLLLTVTKTVNCWRLCVCVCVCVEKLKRNGHERIFFFVSGKHVLKTRALLLPSILL